ncbi:hypothetical protein [Halorubrum ezzemoulense]|nr:hypothetical protein [Halorubrum ezzemoulense]
MFGDEVAFDEFLESITDPSLVDTVGVVVGERVVEWAAVVGGRL